MHSNKYIHPDIEFLNDCIDKLENKKDIISVHNKLKIFTPIYVDETECDILWYKAWRSCPNEKFWHPDDETICKCDILFCDSLIKRIASICGY